MSRLTSSPSNDRCHFVYTSPSALQIWSVVYNIPRFFEYRLETHCADEQNVTLADCNVTYYRIDLTDMREDHLYILVRARVLPLLKVL